MSNTNAEFPSSAKCPFCGTTLAPSRNETTPPRAYCPNDSCDFHNIELNIRQWNIIVSGQNSYRKAETWEVMADALKHALDRMDESIASWEILLVDNPRGLSAETRVEILGKALTTYLDGLQQRRKLC